MKRPQLISTLALSAIFILTLQVPDASTNAAGQHCYRIKEYELFQDVLHPLRETLLQGDFRSIRLMAGELVTRGKAIMDLGVPEAPKARRREFAKKLRNFHRAFARFKTDARTGSPRLKESYTAVHDSFEKLADLVPTVYPGGMPPIITLDCPSSVQKEGSKITLTANAPASEKLAFFWTVGAGKILTGDGTPTITIDTTGLSGQTISVSVEVNDGCGFTVATNCKIQIGEQITPVTIRRPRPLYWMVPFPSIVPLI